MAIASPMFTAVKLPVASIVISLGGSRIGFVRSRTGGTSVIVSSSLDTTSVSLDSSS